MVRSSFSTRNIANYDNNLGKSDPNTALDIEREDEDSIRMACNVNDSGAESIILRSDEDKDEDEDENEYGEGYSDDDDEDQLYDDEGEDRVSRVFGDADFFRPSTLKVRTMGVETSFRICHLWNRTPTVLSRWTILCSQVSLSPLNLLQT